MTPAIVMATQYERMVLVKEGERSDGSPLFNTVVEVSICDAMNQPIWKETCRFNSVHSITKMAAVQAKRDEVTRIKDRIKGNL